MCVTKSDFYLNKLELKRMRQDSVAIIVSKTKPFFILLTIDLSPVFHRRSDLLQEGFLYFFRELLRSQNLSVGKSPVCRRFVISNLQVVVRKIPFEQKGTSLAKYIVEIIDMSDFLLVMQT